MKKKILIVVSAVLIILTSFLLTASASSVLLGDINSSGKIEAADARIALRASVNLEQLSDNEAFIADIDGNNSVTAADARLILRMSVNLEKLIYADTQPENSSFEVHFIDVGQADSALVLCDGKSLLIDGGNVEDSSLVVSYLLSHNIDSLDFVINTHAHEDHVGGLNGPLNKFTVKERIFAPATGASTDCYNDFLAAVKKQNKEITVPVTGYKFSLGSAEVKFIGPIHENYSNLNNTSLVVKITYKDTSFLFMGDAEYESERDMLDAGADVKADVIKIGHHGSETSTGYRLLREAEPSIAVISVAAAKNYGHPEAEVLTRLRDAEVKVYRTDMQGHIVITSDGTELNVTTERNQNAETNPTKPEPVDPLPSEPEIPPTEEPETPPAEEPEKPPIEEPEDIPSSYIGNKNSKVLHLPSCSSLPKESNRVYFADRSDAISSGFTPCKRCKP